MNKKKFETKEEYLEYCKKYEILNIPSKYGSQHTYINEGIKRDTYFGERYISYEPKSYPCIMIWEDNGASIKGVFIYESDFNND